MASKSLAFCQESDIYSDYSPFEPGEHCVTFSKDLTDFDEKLEYYVSNDDERERIIENGYQHVMNNQTWKHRIDEFTRTVKQELF